jgi:hypothetical protein
MPEKNIAQAKTTDEIIAMMQEEADLQKRRDILANMSPKLREKYEWIREWLDTEIKTTLQSRYELGEQVLEIYMDETKNGAKVYGRGAINKICKLLDWDDGVIRACLKLVQTYTREDIVRICALKLPRDEPVTWSHVRTLLEVDDPTQRDELLEKTVAEGLTCTELGLEVKQLVEKAPDDGRGRPVKVPSSFSGLVQQQLQVADTWEKRYAKVWSNSPQSFITRATELQEKELTEEHLRYATVLAHRLRQMADQAVAAAKKAEEVVRQFEQLLAERKKAPLTIDATPSANHEPAASFSTPVANRPQDKPHKEHGAGRATATV